MALDRFDLTNWRKHPTAHGIEVFFFKSVVEGNFFEALLQEQKIWCEKDVDHEREHSRKVMIAVKSKDVPKIIKLNHLTLGKYRKPFVPFRSLRYFLLAFFLLVVFFTVMGIINSGKPL